MIIYYIKNKVNGKGYVGQHCGDKDHRWKQHLRDSLKLSRNEPLYQSMRKYGSDNFTYEVLEEIPIEMGQRELDLREIFWIHNKNTYIKNKNGYNQTLGGGGGVRNFCKAKGESRPSYKWGQYDTFGNFIKSWDTPKQAARILSRDNYRHLYHAANWHEGKGKFGKTFAGYMWKKVPINQELPNQITPLSKLGTKKAPKIKSVTIPSSSTSNNFEIGQYNFEGELVNIWPNNGELIGRTLNLEGDAIRRNLRGEGVLTYGYMWKRFKKGTTPKLIDTAPMQSAGLSIDKFLFYDQPIVKIDLYTQDVMNKYPSIADTPIPFMNQIQIYLEATQKRNLNGDNVLWLFEKDYNSSVIYEKFQESDLHSLKE
jgi:group I intron endonuclease